MFAKLLKYEWKATGGLLGILSGAALGVGLAGGFSFRSLIVASQSIGDDSANALVMAPLAFFLMFAFLALVVYAFAVQIILLSRFYKSRFTDEGYLTFTLPVSTWQNYLSALSNILIWSVISGLVVTVSVVIIILLGASGVPVLDGAQVMEGFTESYQAAFVEEGYAKYMAVSLLYNFVSVFSAPVLLMTCITLGAVLAKKHKVLAAIGVYYAISMAIGMISSVSSAVMLAGDTGILMSEYYAAATAAAGWQILVQIAVCVGGSILSVWLMDKKLNLP